MMMSENESSDYLRSCRSEFWRKVFSAELDYLLQRLRPGDEILSVGCGPALIERGLIERGFSVVGLDVAREAIAGAPDTLRTVVAPAEKLPFADAAFDVVLFIVSLQFVDNYRQALSEARRVLRPGGRMIAMLLNPPRHFSKENTPKRIPTCAGSGIPICTRWNQPLRRDSRSGRSFSRHRRPSSLFQSRAGDSRPLCHSGAQGLGSGPPPIAKCLIELFALEP